MKRTAAYIVPVPEFEDGSNFKRELSKMVKLPVDLLAEEKILDTWVLWYTSPAGDRYSGKCTITNKRIFYDRATLEKDPQETTEDSEGEYLVITKEQISHIETRNTQLEKRIKLILDDGQEHEFNYGTLNIDRIVEAMNFR